jgi:hypothetical protein
MSSSAVLDELAAPRDVVRVLLVEDNPGDRRLVAEMLRDAGDAAVMTSCGRISEAQDPVSRRSRSSSSPGSPTSGSRSRPCRPARRTT